MVKEVAPELTTVSAVVGRSWFPRAPRQKDVVETVCAMSKRAMACLWPRCELASGFRRRGSQEADRARSRCEAVGVAEVVLVIIVVMPPAH